MPSSGPIVIVEDDIDDQHLLQDVINELAIPNEIIFFTRSSDTLQFLRSTAKQPFLIVSDINLPGLNGLEFKMELEQDEKLRRKAFLLYFSLLQPTSVP
jgi:CheY-like chemotaxis protein